jgi:hypothetical protein
MALADDIERALVEVFDERKNVGEFDAALDDFMANEVVEVWRSYSPEDTGKYMDSIEVTRSASGGKGEVSATVDYAHIVEYGSEDTAEYAPRAKTVERLNPGGR